MLIKIKLTPSARKTEIIKQSANFWRVKLTAPPEKGKANEALIKLAADYFKVPKSSVLLKSGKASRYKIIDIKD